MSELIVRTGPSIKRGRSEQVVGTPRVFLDAVEDRFGVITWDLAATADNRVNGRNGLGREDYFGPDHPSERYRDALAADWDMSGTLWCNPPFASIGPWATKCAEARTRCDWTLLLVPASVDSEWFAEHVHGKGLVMPLRPRLKFVGHADPYPKPLMLVAYGFGAVGFEPWRWR